MKKLILSYIIILILLLSVSVKAQQVNSLWFNAVSGLNSSWIINQNAYGNQEFEYATAFGLTGGIGVTYFYKRHRGFSGSILLTQMGQNYSGYQGGADADRKVKLSYVEVPLLFMKDIPGSQFPTWISFGPDVLILLNADQQYTRGEGGSDLPYPEGMIDGNVKARYKPVDIAINFSVNRMYNLDYLRKMMFLFSVNTALGLTDINSTEWQKPNTHDIYTGSHNFYIGFKIGMMFKVARQGGSHRW
jgi:hypothetical protein